MEQVSDIIMTSGRSPGPYKLSLIVSTLFFSPIVCYHHPVSQFNFHLLFCPPASDDHFFRLCVLVHCVFSVSSSIPSLLLSPSRAVSSPPRDSSPLRLPSRLLFSPKRSSLLPSQVVSSSLPIRLLFASPTRVSSPTKPSPLLLVILLLFPSPVVSSSLPSRLLFPSQPTNPARRFLLSSCLYSKASASLTFR